MEKILDSEVRKQLFKTLQESGFSKEEAAKIVSSKYEKELRTATLNHLENIFTLFKDEKYNEIKENSLDFTNITGVKSIEEIAAELERIKQINNPANSTEKKE